MVASDERWRATTGPIRYSDLLHGEHYDARRELGDWTDPGYDDGDWPAVRSRERDGVALVPERAQPIRVTEELQPVSVTEREPGVHVVDFGQNMVGWVRLGGRGRARHDRAAAVRRDARGRTARCTSRTCGRRDRRRRTCCAAAAARSSSRASRSTGSATSRCRGSPEAPTLVGRVVHSDTPWTGRFECSSDLVNRLWHNVTWGQRGNFLSVPTDCPQRDERLGWLADAQVFLPSAALNMDVAAFITKWGDDILDAQSADGAYPDVAPRLGAERDGAPAWGDAGIIVPWTIYERYGDVRILERHWDAMERYMAYLVRHNPDLLWRSRRNNDYGDWLSVGADTPREVLATAYLAYDAKLMARIARRAGTRRPGGPLRRSCTRTSSRRSTERTCARTASSKATRRRSTCWPCTWTSSRTELRERVAERLVADIERHDWHLTTGFIGVGLLCPVLSEAGYADVAYRLLLNETFPSWGYSIRHGATTIWERWDGWTEQQRLPDRADELVQPLLARVGLPVALRVRRPASGSIPSGPATSTSCIAPSPGPLRVGARVLPLRARADHERMAPGPTTAFRLDVEIPANVTATVVLPDGERCDVGSGRHSFSAAWRSERELVRARPRAQL